MLQDLLYNTAIVSAQLWELIGMSFLCYLTANLGPFCQIKS